MSNHELVSLKFTWKVTLILSENWHRMGFLGWTGSLWPSRRPPQEARQGGGAVCDPGECARPVIAPRVCRPPRIWLVRRARHKWPRQSTVLIWSEVAWWAWKMPVRRWSFRLVHLFLCQFGSREILPKFAHFRMLILSELPPKTSIALIQPITCG